MDSHYAWYQESTLDLLCFFSEPPQSTPVDLQTRLTCRISSTECLRADHRLTWQPTEASFPPARLLITHLVPGQAPSPLPQVRQVSTCRARTAQILPSLGPKVANLPDGERRSENPSRGEVCLLCVKIATQGHNEYRAMLVCRLPVGVPRSERIHGYESDQPESRETEEEPLERSRVFQGEGEAAVVL